jgi:hypothetical protein
MPDPSFLDSKGGDPATSFEALINRFQNPSQQAVHSAALVLKEDIRKQALSGVSFTGQPFAPYSTAYARQKGQSNVDLFSKYAEPHMLDLLDARVTQGQIEIGIFDNPEAALRGRINQEGSAFSGRRGGGRLKRIKSRILNIIGRLHGGVPARPWLGVSQRALDQAAQNLVKDIVSDRP